MTAGDTAGLGTVGRTMLRWFSTITPSWRSTKELGSSAAISRRACSLAVVRWSSTQGRVTISHVSFGRRVSNQGAWVRLSLRQMKRPVLVTDSAQMTG